MRWIADHPELALALFAIVGNAVVEVLQRLGFERAASLLASLVPHVRGMLEAFAPKTRAGLAGSDSRPLALDQAAPETTPAPVEAVEVDVDEDKDKAKP